MENGGGRVAKMFVVMWIFFFSLFGLVDQVSVADAGYVNSWVYRYASVGGLNISIVDTLIILSAGLVSIPYLLGKEKFTKEVLFILGLILLIFSASEIRGMLRLPGSETIGLAELKSLVFLIVFVFLTRKACDTNNERLLIYIPATVIMVRMILEILRFVYFPYVDNNIGSRTVIPPQILVFVPPMIMELFRTRRMLSKNFLSFTLLLVTIVVILTWSRGLIFIFITTVLLVFIFFPYFCSSRRGRKGILRTSTIIMISFSPILFIGAADYFFKSDFIGSYYFWGSANKDSFSASNLAHFHDIVRGILLISKNPFFGLGLGGSFPAYKTAVFPGVIHNEFLFFWVVFGFFGMLLWLYMFILLPLRTFMRVKISRNHGKLPILSSVVLMAIPYAIVQATVSPPFIFNLQKIFMVALLLAIQYHTICVKVEKRAAK